MKAILAMLTLGASALAVNAQDANDGDQNGPSSRGHHPPPPAIIAAIDANHDGVIDVDEIANASAALKSLDKNGDGVLTPDEFDGRRPHRPPPEDADSNRPNGDLNGPPEGAPPGSPDGQ
jgi:hypothetical protein